MTRVYWKVTLMLLLVACRGHFADSNNGKDTTSSTQNDKASTRPSDESEGLPGYDLVCAFISDPTPALPEAKLGCRFAEATTGVTADMNTLATQWKWDYAKPDGVTIDVSSLEQGAGAEWQVIYTFTGTDGDLVKSGALKTHVVVILALKNGDNKTIDEPVENIPTPGNLGSGTESSPG